MSNRWAVLALLFLVRGLLGFQFQFVATLAPLVQRDYVASIADIGFLIGIYLAPGIFFALPGGAIGRRFGDKRVVLFGLALMMFGSVVMAIGETWGLQTTGRVVAGSGGVLLNVVMAKMVADWFAGHEIATAMAVFVNAWPFGIAFALLILPKVALWGGLGLAHVLTIALIVVGMICLAASYRPPAEVAGSAPVAKPLSGAVVSAVVAAGAV